MYDSHNRAEVASPGQPLKALEDDASGKETRVLLLSKKSWLLVDKMSHWTNLPCFTINLSLVKYSTHPIS